MDRFSVMAGVNAPRRGLRDTRICNESRINRNATCVTDAVPPDLDLG